MMDTTEETPPKTRSFRLDLDVSKALQRWAEQEHRTVNNAANALLRRALTTEGHLE